MTIEFRFETKLPNIMCSFFGHDLRPIKRTSLLVYNQLPERQCQRCGKELYATENKVSVKTAVWNRFKPKKKNEPTRHNK